MCDQKQMTLIFDENWSDALNNAVQRAKNYFPSEQHPRIEKALTIIKERRILVLRSGAAIVESDDSTADDPKIYNINMGRCECPDAESRNRWCKHNIARALVIRATQYLNELPAI